MFERSCSRHTHGTMLTLSVAVLIAGFVGFISTGVGYWMITLPVAYVLSRSTYRTAKGQRRAGEARRESDTRSAA